MAFDVELYDSTNRDSLRETVCGKYGRVCVWRSRVLETGENLIKTD